MGDERIGRILARLSDNYYHTAQSLAEKEGICSKTIRGLLKDTDAVLKKNSVGYIESKHGSGFRLVIDDQSRFAFFLSELSAGENLPDNSKTRVRCLTDLLLGSKDYIKLDQLEKTLFVSRNTLTADLKEVERLLNSYGIKLKRRPHYGIKALGKEFNFRLCIANQLLEKDDFCFQGERDGRHTIKQIAGCVVSFLEEVSIPMSDVALHNLTVHIYVAVMRAKEGAFTDLGEDILEGFDIGNEYAAAKLLIQKLNQIFGITVPQSEAGYLAIHLAGKKMWGEGGERVKNTVISPRINAVVTEIIAKVNQLFKIDLHENLELRMSLCQHLLALEIRIQYGMNMKNPLLNEIKTHNAFAYMVSAQVCTVINDFYGTKLRDDEIGYFALIFALALERHRTKIHKKNILLVCSTGKGSANLLKYRYMEEFSSYLKEIHTCEVQTLDKVDFSAIDYVFTTVPIGIRVPVPIMEVQYFLGHDDIMAVKKTLKSINAKTSVRQFYQEQLFIPSLDCKTRGEVLQAMCRHISVRVPVPDDFYGSVMKRESLARTEFGNNVAMPHPDVPLTEETFVCVAVLKTPILWEEQPVQLIFLVSTSCKADINLGAFYDVTAKLLLSGEYVGKIIKARNYQMLARLLESIERE